MSMFSVISDRARRILPDLAAWLASRWHHRLYLYLALFSSVFIVVDAAVLRFTGNMRQSAFDAMVRYRIIVPKPDPDIVIVDINEASLAAMAKEYGRWPWPRQVFGEFLEQLETQRPKAVVFDILLSDADVYNPDSDRYFDAAVAETTNTFFPMLRLDPASDTQSQITPDMLPGVTPAPGETQYKTPIAIVLPHFRSVLSGGRLGLHNIYPDADGVVREYTVARHDYGWEIPSLPARVTRELGYGTPAVDRIILNWRGKPFTYPAAGFSDVFDDMQSKTKRRPQHEFTNKIVIIGSTAPSLFDVKPTPLSRLHPGVEILATALDNMKRGDYLRYPQGRVLYPLLSLVIVWSTAWAFYRSVGRSQIDRLFGASQFILLAVSFASINLTHTYINLTGPVTIGLAYFTVARLYAAATSGTLEVSAVRRSVGQEGELCATLLLVRAGESGDGRTLEAVRKRLTRLCRESKSVELLKGRQQGLWALFEGTLAVSWVVPAQDAAAQKRVVEEVAAVTSVLDALPPNRHGGDAAVAWFVHEDRIAGGPAARSDWRALFGDACVRWHRANRQQGEGNA